MPCEAVLPHVERLAAPARGSPCVSAKRRARLRNSDWMSSALTSRPFASLTVRVQVGSWLISRIARIGFSSVMSRSTTPAPRASAAARAAPTFRKVAYSLMLESPTMTWRRR